MRRPGFEPGSPANFLFGENLLDAELCEVWNLSERQREGFAAKVEGRGLSHWTIAAKLYREVSSRVDGARHRLR